MCSAAGAPSDRCNEHFDEVAESDHGDEAADDQLERTKAVPSGRQDAIDDDSRYRHSGQERDLEQQRQANRTAQELGEIGGDRGDFADDPHRPDDRLREPLAAHLGEIATGDDPKLGRERLEQHRYEIGEQHNP